MSPKEKARGSSVRNRFFEISYCPGHLVCPLFLLLCRSQNQIHNRPAGISVSASFYYVERACYLKILVWVREPFWFGHLPSLPSLYHAMSDMGDEVMDHRGARNGVDGAEGRASGILQEIADLKMTKVRLQRERKEAARLLKRKERKMVRMRATLAKFSQAELQELLQLKVQVAPNPKAKAKARA